MYKLIFSALFFTLICSVNSAAQKPPPPKPTIEVDVRDNTIRMRSMELERIKREAARPRYDTDAIKTKERFALVKKNFEKIQTLQNSIIKVYTHGKTINFAKISELSGEMNENALSLNSNLFGEEGDAKLKRSLEKQVNLSVRNLIIELDNAIGNFVKSPIFKNIQVVDSEISKDTQKRLNKIIFLSDLLKKEAYGNR